MLQVNPFLTGCVETKPVLVLGMQDCQAEDRSVHRPRYAKIVPGALFEKARRLLASSVGSPRKEELLQARLPIRDWSTVH